MPTEVLKVEDLKVGAILTNKKMCNYRSGDKITFYRIVKFNSKKVYLEVLNKRYRQFNSENAFVTPTNEVVYDLEDEMEYVLSRYLLYNKSEVYQERRWEMKVGDIKDDYNCFRKIEDSVDFQKDCDNCQVGDIIADYNISYNGFNNFYRIVDVMNEKIILDRHYEDDYLYIRDISDIKSGKKKCPLIMKNVSDGEWESFDHCKKYESFINDKKNKCICQGKNCQNQSEYSIEMNKKTQYIFANNA